MIVRPLDKIDLGAGGFAIEVGTAILPSGSKVVHLGRRRGDAGGALALWFPAGAAREIAAAQKHAADVVEFRGAATKDADEGPPPVGMPRNRGARSSRSERGVARTHRVKEAGGSQAPLS